MTISVQATFAATLVDEWLRCGVVDAVVCPGSRSTPMAVALHRSSLSVHVIVDERSAGFTALGLARATGRCVPVLTTSGSAAAELHPAIVEAHHSGLPLIAVTADRPPELHGVRAPQTCEQHGIYGSAPRWSFDPGVARPETARVWRSIASRCVAEALFGPSGPGPVHLNLPFAEPLVGEPGELPEGRPDGGPWHRVLPPLMRPDAELIEEVASLAGSRGLVVAGGPYGPWQGDQVTALQEVAAALGWPLLADPLSGARRIPSGPAPSQDGYPEIVVAADSILRFPDWARAMTPEVVLRVGRPWASRVVEEWIQDSGARQVLVDPWWDWADPGHVAGTVARCDPTELCRSVLGELRGRDRRHGTGGDPSSWLGSWRAAEGAAQLAIDGSLVAGDGLTEPWIARELVGRVGHDDALVVSSSLPVREVEWFTTAGPSYPRVIANRGVNGIDGVVSTACGVARSGTFGETFVLVGDLAFLHDAGALMAFPRDSILTVVVVDNGGGAIFDLLPQASALDPEAYARLFTTRQESDLLELAKAHGARSIEVRDKAALREALDRERVPGVVVIVCRIEAGSTAKVHRDLSDAVAEELAGVIG